MPATSPAEPSNDHNGHGPEAEDHDRGLSFDLGTLLHRRKALALIGGAGLATFIGCGSGGDDDASGASSTTSGSTSAGSTSGSGGSSSSSSPAAAAGTAIPEETAGPFPGDGSNGVNVLTESGIVRRDITSSFGSSSGTAAGVPLTITLKVLSVADGAAPMEGAAVYIWHCDREGRYSLYSDGATDQNYLRGVQEAGSDGTVTFESIFPGAYPGRWPHVHFEVYQDVATATAAGSKLRTSQLAFPRDACEAAYAADGYEASLSNLASLSLDTDMVFSDGYSLQLGQVTGSAADGMTVTLAVPV